MSNDVARPGTASELPTARKYPVSAGAAFGVVLGLTTTVPAAVGVWLTWRVFVATSAGQRVDQAVFEGARFGSNRLWQVAGPVLDVISVPSVAVVLVAAVLIAVVRRRWGLALQVALLVGGANLTTQLLKNFVLERPDLGATSVFSNTLPSGHTTAAASVSAALVFVLPPRARPWAAVFGAVFTAATGVSTLVGRWHRPSDVVAAVLVVLAWSGLACALAAVSLPWAADGTPTAVTGELVRPDRSLEPSRDRSAQPRRGASATAVGVGLLALAGLVAALPAGISMNASWTTPGVLSTRAELLVAYAGGAFGVVAVSCLAFAVLLAVRHAAGRTV
ncbi:MAG TPA: phosphatase PAP2 family protein [Pengzhenrongella sp.]